LRLAAALKAVVISPAILNLEKLVGTARDGALLRYSLGNEYLKAGDSARATEHLSVAVERDPNYSAAWKLLGRACSEAGKPAEALRAWLRGIEVAESRGDKQAAREMTVFPRRVQKQLDP
jgi:predicted Zn-dependent protease